MVPGSSAPEPEQVAAFFTKHRTGLVTLVFTDLVDSSGLLRKLGDQAGATFMQRRRQLMREVLSLFPEGEEIGTAGDSFLLAFTKPSDAVRYALQVQARLRGFSRESGLSVQERIGIHLGEVVIAEHETQTKAKDLYGLQITTCARVMSLAQGGQTLLTRGVFDSARQVLKGEDLPGVGALSWVSHGPYQLKGIEEPVEVDEVGETGQSPLSAPRTSEKARRVEAAEGEAVLGWRPAVGQLVPNTQWLLENRLGEGGFGEVWLGRHQAMKERRVFKFCFRADRVRSLKREMTLFRLIKERIGDHPNIVALREVYFEQPPYYVEEDYVAGQELAKWCESQGGPDKVPLEVKLEIVAQIADALQAAHDAGVIHRDVKPGNILVAGSGSSAGWEPAVSLTGSRLGARDSTGPADYQSAARQTPGPRCVAKLTDFGIGQVISEEALAGMTRAGFTQTMLSSSSSQTGTQLYMSPELLAGKPASTRSDIYSLGVVLYQLLAGDFTRPITTDWADDITDPLLESDLQHCFAGNPQGRFAGAGLLAWNLRALPHRQAERMRLQAEQAARERTAYRLGLVRATSVAVLIVLGMAALVAVAVRQRNRARAEEQSNRRLLYASEVNLAHHAWREGKLFRARELLLRQRPPPGQENLRGFEWRFLWQLCQGDALVTLRGHRGLAQSVAVSPDGRLLASADFGAGGLVYIWDVALRRELIPPLGDVSGARSVAFSRNGKLLVAGGWNGKIRIWETATWSGIMTFDAGGTVERVAFSPNGRWLVAGSAGAEVVKLWNLETKALLTTFTGPTTTRPCVAFSPDSRLVAYGLGDNTVKLVEVPALHDHGTLHGHENIVVHLEFSPDGQTLATASTDTTVRLWEVSQAKEVGTFSGHKAHVTSVAFSPDGRTLATSCADTTIKLWDFASRKELATLLGHTKWVNNVVFFPDGTLLASSSDDQTIKLWEARPKPAPVPFGVETNVTTFARLSADRKSLLAVQRDNSVILRETATWTPRATLRAASSVGVAVLSPRSFAERSLSGADEFEFNTFAAAFSRDDRRVAVVFLDSSVKVFDVATGKEQAAWRTPVKGIRNAVLSADGRRLAFLSETDEVMVCDTASGKSAGRFEGDNLEFLVDPPDGRILVSRYAGAAHELWDVPDQKHKVTFKADAALLRGYLAVSANFKLAARGVEGGKVWVWKCDTGEPLGSLAGHRGLWAVWAVRFSPDGKTLATGGEDGTIRLWDLQHMREVAELRGHSGWVVGLDFSRDGRTLASASNDGTAKLWSLSSLTEVTTLPANVASHSQIHFAGADHALLSLGEDKLLRFWRAPSLAEIDSLEGAKAKAR